MAILAQEEIDVLVANTELFSYDIDLASKNWFVKRIVAHCKSAATADVISESKQYLQKAKQIVTDYVDPPREYWPLELDYVETKDQYSNKIIYGVLGVHPDVFLDQSNPSLLKFIVERRLRSVMQMRYFVNHESPSYFEYPSGDLETMTIRPSAKNLWEGIVTDRNNNKIWPFKLSSTGKQKPDEAVSQLFASTVSVANDFHQVDCQTAVLMVLLDSLLSASDPKKFFTVLAGEGDDYLTIDHIDGSMRLLQNVNRYFGGSIHVVTAVNPGANVKILVEPAFQFPLLPQEFSLVQGVKKEIVKILTLLLPTNTTNDFPVDETASPVAPVELTAENVVSQWSPGTRLAEKSAPLFHILNDARPDKALFERVEIPRDELQIGDVLHIMSHPFYRAKLPWSAWGGDRCVLWNPMTDFSWQMRVTAHGEDEDTILDLLYDPVMWSNQVLAIARTILDECLAMSATSRVGSGMIPDPNTPVETQKTIETAVLYALGMAGSNLQFEGKWELHEFPKISLTERSEYPWQLIIDPLLEPDPSDENEQPRDAFPTHRVLALDDWVLKRNGQVVFPVIPGARVPKNSLFIFEYQPYKRVDLTLTTGWPNPSIGNYVGLWNHSSHNGGQSTRLHFVIPYFDDVGAVLKAMPLYYGQGKSTGQRVLLTYDDLYKNLYAFAPEEGPIPVIRPRVYASPNYLTYLKDLGAIS